jgi:microcystin-dependent protein
MAEPFIGEIRLFSFGVIPKGWALCDGSVLQASQNQVLFSLLGPRYGGDGVNTFALPDFRGRTPMAFGGDFYLLGVSGGEETHVLTSDEVAVPTHTHTVIATNDPATTDAAQGNVFAASGGDVYGSLSDPASAMSSAAVSTVGGQPHENMQPYLALNFCIATEGVTPPKPGPLPLRVGDLGYDSVEGYLFWKKKWADNAKEGKNWLGIRTRWPK